MAIKYPNIILIIMDTAGAQHMSLYGYHRRTTPELERLATEATLYTRCFAPGCWTLPSHASMFTGLYPSEHGVDGNDVILDPNYQHIVSVLKQSGYRTYGISCNGIVSPVYGNCRDFDVFREYGTIGWSVQRLRTKDDKTQELYKKFRSKEFLQRPSRWLKLYLFLEHMIRHKDLSVLSTLLKRSLTGLLPIGAVNRSAPYTKRTFRTALNDIQRHLNSSPKIPFFYFINVVENHAFYNPPKAVRRFSGHNDKQPFFTVFFNGEEYAAMQSKLLPTCKDLYDDEMVFLDSLVSQFWERLRTMGGLDNTVLIVASDHGEHFGEKGFYEHRLSLLNQLIWVPLLIRFPRGMRPVGTDDRLVSLNDLFSTFLDLMDSPFPRPRHSQSLLSAEKRGSVSSMILDNMPFKVKMATILNKSQEWAEALPSYNYALILENGLKLLAKDNHGGVEIYNVGRDPEENHDLSSNLPPQLYQELLAILADDQRQTGFKG